MSEKPLTCYDCGFAYGHPAWIEAVVPNDVWRALSPDGDGNGILCIQCIALRCARIGIENVPVKLTAGPLGRVDYAPSLPVAVEVVRDALVNVSDATEGDIESALFGRLVRSDRQFASSELLDAMLDALSAAHSPSLPAPDTPEDEAQRWHTGAEDA